jgi:hypothetical protein
VLPCPFRSGLPTEQATERPVGIALQRNATEVVVDVFGALTPDVLKPWIGAQVTGVSQAPVATGTADDSSYVRVMNGTASLTLLVLIVWIAFAVVEWRWRAWDSAEVGRLFERKDYRVLEPQFVVFLFTTILVLELVGFFAAGWMTHLRHAPNRLLGLMMVAALLVALMAAIPWIFKLFWSLISAPDRALGLFNRGLCAGSVAFMSVLPAFVAIGARLVGRNANELDNAAFMEPVGWWILLVLLIVWIVPTFSLWSRVEQFVARRTCAQPIPGSTGH